jgi:hypothetical protein
MNYGIVVLVALNERFADAEDISLLPSNRRSTTLWIPLR